MKRITRGLVLMLLAGGLLLTTCQKDHFDLNKLLPVAFTYHLLRNA
jgi:hypothetical protein